MKAHQVLLFILFLSVASLPQALTPTRAQLQTCNQNQIMHMTLGFQGAPHTLNPFAGGFIGEAGIFLDSLEYLQLIPNVFQNNSYDWSTGITSSFSHNDNYTKWTFNIKPGLKWSDGASVTSQDILATYNTSYALNPSYDVFGIGPEIARRYAVNSSTTIFQLNVTDAHFPERISYAYQVGVYPTSVVAQGVSNNFFGKEPVDGPFQIQNYQPGSTEMILLRNPQYSPLPQVCEIDVNFVESESLTPIYVTSGTTDLADISNSQAQAVFASPNIGITQTNGTQITAIELNNTVYPYNMTAFRQALVYAINDMQIIGKAFDGFASPGVQGTVSPSSVYYDPNQKQYAYNQTEALSLLQSIGIVKGANGYLHYPNGTDVSITLWADSGKTSDELAAGVIQNNLQALGMHVSVQIAQISTIASDLFTNRQNIQQALVLYTNAGTAFNDPWLSAQPGFSVYLNGLPGPYWEYPPSLNTEYQNNLTAIDSTNDPTAVRHYLNNIQELNAESIPTIIVAYPDFLLANSKSHFNIPQTLMDYDAGILSAGQFASIFPIVAQTSTSTSTITPSIDYTPYLGAIGVIIVAAIGIMLFRRRASQRSRATAP